MPATKSTRPAKKTTPARSTAPDSGPVPSSEARVQDTGPVALATPTKSAPAAKPRQKKCNVPTCRKTPTHRGLCVPHWGTHRGLADPKETDR